MIRKLIKVVLTLNLALVIRTLRFGLRDAFLKMVDAYRSILPLERRIKQTTPVEKQLERIRTVDVDELVREFPRIILDSGYQHVDGALPLKQLTALLALLCDRRPDIVVEIGTFLGTTTKALALNAPAAAIHTVDLPLDFDPTVPNDPNMPKDDFKLIRGRRVGEAFRGDAACGNIVQHFVDTASWDFSPARGASFFFIDGSHTYEYAKNDTLKCMSICAPKSTFVWHDCDPTHPEVVRYLHELATQGYDVVRIRDTQLAVLDYSK